jgi:hypothetical protein
MDSKRRRKLRRKLLAPYWEKISFGTAQLHITMGTQLYYTRAHVPRQTPELWKDIWVLRPDLFYWLKK